MIQLEQSIGKVPSFTRYQNYSIQQFHPLNYHLLCSYICYSYYFQVSKLIISDNNFLEEAVASYKAFLHTIKIKDERSMNFECVLAYDIELIWHSHQLHPLFYCQDLTKICGRVLDHNDRDSDVTKMKVWFGRTKNFGKRHLLGNTSC